MTDLLQLTVNGLVAGSVIAIGAVGLTLVYGILRIVNFAHGDYLTFGAYMALVGNVSWGLHPVTATVFAVGVTMVFSVALEYGLWRPLRVRGAGLTSLFLTSIGVALVLRHAIQWYWGTNPYRYDVDVFSSYVTAIGGTRLFRISQNQITVIVTTAVLIIAVGLFMSRSRTGKAMRALSDDVGLAAVSGIDTDRVITQTWIVAGGLAGLAGVLLAVLQSALTPNTGWFLLLPIFAAVVLGGVGSPYGALAGGIVMGLVMELSTLALPATYKNGVAFAAMIVALLVRPQGLFGKARVL